MPIIHTIDNSGEGEMARNTNDLKRMLKSGKLDSSDFILIGLDILEKEKRTLEDQTAMNEAIHSIKIDYLDISYDNAVSKLITAAESLGEPDIGELFKETATKAAKNSKPEQVESRRYFENRFVNEQWEALDTPAHHDSLDRLAKFMVGANLRYAEGENFSDLRKVNDLTEMEMVIAALRGFGETTDAIFEQENAMRAEEKTPLSGFKDRGAKRGSDDVGHSMNPGIIKANSPMPLDERRERVVKGSITDSFLINRRMEKGYSAGNVDVPFVNSVSGTAYTLAAVLQQYMKANENSPTLQQDMDHIVQTFVAFTCKSGFHSLPEMMDVLRSPEVTDVFDSYNLTINNPFSKNTLDTAINAASHYTETRQSQKGVLGGLSQHGLFKRHVEPTTKVGYPEEIALRVSENKQTGPRVAEALREMYEKGKEGKEEYSPENCREIAQQYINYANHNHRHFNLTDVKRFVNDMNQVIKQNVEQIEERIDHIVKPF